MYTYIQCYTVTYITCMLYYTSVWCYSIFMCVYYTYVLCYVSVFIFCVIMTACMCVQTHVLTDFVVHVFLFQDTRQTSGGQDERVRCLCSTELMHSSYFCLTLY